MDWILIFEEACDESINNDIDLFVSDVDTSLERGVFFELLTSEFEKVEGALNSECWVTLTNEIYIDKKAIGFWIIKESNPDTLPTLPTLGSVQKSLSFQ